jgi:hypothetical protein
MNVSVMAVTSVMGPFSHKRHIDVVREQVTGDAAARYGDIQTPQPLTALRQVARDGPVLQEFER